MKTTLPRHAKSGERCLRGQVDMMGKSWSRQVEEVDVVQERADSDLERDLDMQKWTSNDKL